MSKSAFDKVHERRTVLKAVLGLGLGLPLFDVAAAQPVSPAQSVNPVQSVNPKDARPQEGDHFAFTSGAREGEIIKPDDLPLGGPSVIAFPVDPQTKLVRDGSRLNRVLLVRLSPQDLTETTRAHSADGIVAYSAVCTHTGCDVSEWEMERKTFKCPCHFSVFDPKNGAHVLDGPAPKRLVALPLKIADGGLVAAGSFRGRPGFQQA
jgi:rieske iron-sulfur protein